MEMQQFSTALFKAPDDDRYQSKHVVQECYDKIILK
jgi:hypothetical protein